MLALKKLVTLAICLVAPASAMGITRRLEGSACVDEPDAVLPGGWDCGRIAEYIAGSDVHSCSWAGPWLSVMVAPKLAEEAAAKCPLSCNECAPDDVDAVDDRVEDNAPAAGLAKDDPAYEPEAPDAPTTEGEPDGDPEAIAAAAAAGARVARTTRRSGTARRRVGNACRSTTWRQLSRPRSPPRRRTTPAPRPAAVSGVKHDEGN